jgi:mannose-6-phosphate isomerase-like protein (cupin superfamily)
MGGRSLEREPLHLGQGASAIPQPDFTGAPQWYEAYVTRHAADGQYGRLVAAHKFTESWVGWEMHPAGDEVVYCMRGAMTLHQEFPDGHCETISIAAGEYAINPPGVWHTADVEGEAEALFITPGWGTEHRPR